MTIEKNDIVGLARDVDPELTEGLVGVVTECHEDGFDVKFPLPGKSLQAQVAKEDVEFIVGNTATPESDQQGQK